MVREKRQKRGRRKKPLFCRLFSVQSGIWWSRKKCGKIHRKSLTIPTDKKGDDEGGSHRYVEYHQKP